MTWTDEHSYSGLKHHEDAMYVGRVHTCECGFRSPEKSEVIQHVREEGESDAMQQAIERAVAVLQARSLAVEFPPVIREKDAQSKTTAPCGQQIGPKGTSVGHAPSIPPANQGPVLVGQKVCDGWVR